MNLATTASTLFALLAVVGTTTQPTDPRANLAVFRKELGQGRRIVVERAYVYEYEKPSTIPHFQYTFVLDQDQPKHSRKVLWMRTGWETGLSAFLPQPEIQVLDATVSATGELLVLYNQYGDCWAYRIQAGKHDRTWTVFPDESGM